MGNRNGTCRCLGLGQNWLAGLTIPKSLHTNPIKAGQEFSLGIESDIDDLGSMPWQYMNQLIGILHIPNIDIGIMSPTSGVISAGSQPLSVAAPGKNTASVESDRSPYGMLLATLAVMAAIAVRRQRTGRS